MSAENDITFVIAVNDRELLKRNFLASPCLTEMKGHEILVQESFTSASTAFNDAIDRARNDLIIFCHQDMLLPQDWLLRLQKALRWLDDHDPHWGVLGTYGKTQDGSGWGHVYSSGRGVIGEPFAEPIPVQTLDEIVLILRKSSGLRFDESLPHFHFYGTDICLRAASIERRSYAISAFCVHHTHQPLVLPNEFYECCRHIRRVWKASLPIQTTCIRLTRSNVPVFRRRLREFYLRWIRHKQYGGTRVQNPLNLLEDLR
jgi:glycosyltransferase involved in cell wall biosynthesis